MALTMAEISSLALQPRCAITAAVAMPGPQALSMMIDVALTDGVAVIRNSASTILYVELPVDRLYPAVM